MCIFIYTLPQKCGHTFFQNVYECPIACGLAPTTENRLDATLSKTKFLFDTSRSRNHTPETYTRAFPCEKRKAVRPVQTLCDKCIRNTKEIQREAEREHESQMMGGSLKVRPSEGGKVGRGVESSGSAAALMVPGELGASSTLSSLHDVSGTSTPRSCGKKVRPQEMI